MNNIPIFTAVNGMATLILKEVPVCGRAYVMLRSVWNGKTAALLEECAQFCRAVGAEEIFACDDGNELPAEAAYEVVELSISKDALPKPQKPVELVPLRQDNSAEYLRIFNGCFRDLHSAASYGPADIRRLLGKDLAFLARVDGQYAGIAELGDNYLEAVAVLPQFRGLGFDLTASVLAKLPGPVVRLKVASTNERALRLYRRMGFGEDRTVRKWFRL